MEIDYFYRPFGDGRCALKLSLSDNPNRQAGDIFYGGLDGCKESTWLEYGTFEVVAEPSFFYPVADKAALETQYNETLYTEHGRTCWSYRTYYLKPNLGDLAFQADPGKPSGFAQYCFMQKEEGEPAFIEILQQTIEERVDSLESQVKSLKQQADNQQKEINSLISVIGNFVGR